jgi:predicted small metal-binding protein
MAKYYIDCCDVGYQDCDFRTEADSVEQVVERCADHGREQHGLRGFGPELYSRMRPHIRLLEDGSRLAGS